MTARVTPQEGEGVRRFMADYRASTCYRVKVPAGSDWVSHPTLPTYPTWTEAELSAARIAGPTRVDAERSGGNGSIEGGVFAAAALTVVDSPVGERTTAQLPPSDLDCQPAPLFCQCGHAEDEHYMGSVCQKIEGMHVCGCEHFIEESHCLGACGAELSGENGEDRGYCHRCAALLRKGAA